MKPELDDDELGNPAPGAIEKLQEAIGMNPDAILLTKDELGLITSEIHFTGSIAQFNWLCWEAIKLAAVRKVAVWGNELCAEHGEPLFRHQCSYCWQELCQVAGLEVKDES